MSLMDEFDKRFNAVDLSKNGDGGYTNSLVNAMYRGYRAAHASQQARIDALEAKLAELLNSLKDAEFSLRSISVHAGKDEYMKDFTQIRGYANSRSRVAKEAIDQAIKKDKQ